MWRMGKHAHQLLLESRISDRGCNFAGIHHNIPAAREPRPVLAENFPDPPLDPVAEHCATHAHRHCDPQTCFC